MHVGRRFTVSVALAFVALSLIPGQSSAYDSVDLTVTISDDYIEIGRALEVNITVNTTDPITYNNARIIISNFETGYIVENSYINLSGRYAWFLPNITYTITGSYEYEPERPIEFGEYTLWVTVGNVSSFQRFDIVPSISDLYEDIEKIEEANQIADENYLYLIQIVYPAAFLLSAMTILVCYYLWRLPDSSKEELRYWLLSKGDMSKLLKIKKDLRDLDKMAYMTRNAPVVGRNEAEIVKLSRHLRVIENLKKYTDKRIAKVNKMSSNAETFSVHLQEVVDGINEEITVRNANVEKALEALELEAQRLNRKVKKNQKSFDVDRFKRMMHKRDSQ